MDAVTFNMTDTSHASMEINVHEGDCSLATALAAGRMMLTSAPLLSTCRVSMLTDNGIFSVILVLTESGNITERYEASAFKQKII